jgi:hypothetical protein
LALLLRRDYRAVTAAGGQAALEKIKEIGAPAVRTHMGVLLVPKGFELTDVFIERMRNFGPGILSERIRVSAPSVATPRNPRGSDLFLLEDNARR